MRKILASICALIALTSGAQLTDQHQAVNADGTVTFAVTVENINDGDLLTIIRKAGGIYTTIVGNNDYHPFEWGGGDEFTIENGMARFADTFECPDYMAHYTFKLNYETIAEVDVNFMDLCTWANTPTIQTDAVIYDLQGNRVSETKPNTIYIINGLKTIRL